MITQEEKYTRLRIDELTAHGRRNIILDDKRSHSEWFNLSDENVKQIRDM